MSCEKKSFFDKNLFYNFWAKSNFQFRNSIVILDDEIASKELFDKFVQDEHNLTTEEIRLISNHLWKLDRLLDFDPVRYKILSEWILYTTEYLTKLSLSKRGK